jgi:GrpB-like predicted nucleotidyltransferase (UPF0157 family)
MLTSALSAAGPIIARTPRTRRNAPAPDVTAAVPAARPEARTHHLQVVEQGRPHVRALLAFRDVLRADAGLRREYAGLKDQLTEQHPESRNAYTNAKGAFIERVLRQAGIEPPPPDLLPE